MTNGADDKTIDILLVEDNQGDINLIAEAIKDCKVQNSLHVVNNGMQAMTYLHRKSDYAHASRPDIIFLDLNLPIIDGKQVLSQIKSDLDLKRIPTLILTSSNAKKDVDICYSLQANCYITKPMVWNEYKNLMNRIEDFWFRTVQLPCG